MSHTPIHSQELALASYPGPSPEKSLGTRLEFASDWLAEENTDVFDYARHSLAHVSFIM